MEVFSPRQQTPAIDVDDPFAAGPSGEARLHASTPSSILRKRRAWKESHLPKRRQRAELDRKVSITAMKTPI